MKNVQFISLGNAAAFETLNPSRVIDGNQDKASWGQPEHTLPVPLIHGYDTSKGTLNVHDMSQVSPDDPTLPDIPTAESAKATQREVIKSLRQMTENKVKGYQIEYEVPLELIPIEVQKSDKFTINNGIVKVTITTADVADILEEYLKNNQKLKYWVVSGQRRTAAWPYAIALHRKLCIGYDADGQRFYVDEPDASHQNDLKFVTKIIDYVDWPTTTQLILDENADNGKQFSSQENQFANACLLVKQRPTRSATDVGILLGLADKKNRAKVNKLYQWARLNSRIPEFNLVNRVALMVPELDDDGKVVYKINGHIPIRKLGSDYQVPVDLLNDVDRKAKNSRYLKGVNEVDRDVRIAMSTATIDTFDDIGNARGLVDAGKLESSVWTRQATTEECERFIRIRMTGWGATTPKTDPLDNKTLDTLVKSKPSESESSELLSAILDGDEDKLIASAELLDTFASVGKLAELVESDHPLYSLFETMLTANRTEFIAQLEAIDSVTYRETETVAE